MQKIEWKKDFELDIKIIDEQHKKLVTIINELLDVIQTEPINEKMILTSIDDVKKYSTEHFATEEGYMKEFSCNNTDSHIEVHDQFVNKLTAIENKINEAGTSMAFELIDFLIHWFVTHEAEFDKKFVKCFKNNGL